MRLAVWLLLAALLILCGIYPQLAASLATLVEVAFGMVLTGIAEVLAQPALAALAAAGVVAVRLQRRWA
ncbi:hypothetical protein U9R90_05260 [Streptomyces sp. E11-3]|uniref:hypothetical protein n=1 Tax=Streptomyces sp. E11-3 TaxID=3110112 RepID=UPI00397F4DD4